MSCICPYGVTLKEMGCKLFLYLLYWPIWFLECNNQPWPLILWLLAAPYHQQPCHWSQIVIALSSIKKDQTTCAISELRHYRKFKYIFDIFLEINPRDKGQITPSAAETYWQMIACDLALHHLVSCYHCNRQLQCHCFLVFYAVYRKDSYRTAGNINQKTFQLPCIYECVNVFPFIYYLHCSYEFFFFYFVHFLSLHQ